MAKEGKSILADLFEALIGALYLDQGLEKAVSSFFFYHFDHEVENLIADPQRNWKAELQDLTQKKYQQTPIYEVIEERGPAHSKHFALPSWSMKKNGGRERDLLKKRLKRSRQKCARKTRPFA